MTRCRSRRRSPRGYCHETAGSQGYTKVSETYDEALWPAGFNGHGQATVIPGCDEGGWQRGSPRDQALAQQPGRKRTSSFSKAGRGNGAVQRHQDPPEIRRCPCFDLQPFQPPTPSQPPRHFQTRPSRHFSRVVSMCSLTALNRKSYRSYPVSLTMHNSGTWPTRLTAACGGQSPNDKT